MALFIGVMSGTSMDAVDAALVDLSSRAPRLLATHSATWPDDLHARLRDLAAGGRIDATQLATLDTEAGEFIATVVTDLLNRSATPADRVVAIGCHGQTVAHAPDTRFPTTLQIGDANVIAERTGITTVNDFRRRDMASGGQGAPLAPAFHAATLTHAHEQRAVINLGGIANLTLLPPTGAGDVVGFDTGPANCLMDLWVRRHHGAAFDRDGNWAASASADPELLSRLLDDPYFARTPPKSTGTQHFSADWLELRLSTAGDLSPAQVQATLLALTCRTVADALRTHAPRTQRVLVCGGGAHNRHLMARLADALGLPVQSTAEYGIDPGWMEPMAFAWLAQRAMAREPGNLPSVTGSRAQRVLGAIHPA